MATYRDMGLSSQFIDAIQDDTISVAVDPVAGVSAPALVCFGGIAGGLLGPPFEFLRLTEHLNVSRVFVRDLEQCWYQRGLKGLGTNVLDTAGGLSKLVSNCSPTRTVFVGTSSGGFAAAMFGSLLGADEVIAISPQTTIRRIHRLRLGDRRWKLQIRKARASCIDPVHLDLVAMRNEGPYYPPLSIHYGRADRLDAAHAARLNGLESVNLVAHDGGHGVARVLRDSQELTAILLGALVPGT